MKIITIDPGYDRVGIAVLEKSVETDNKEILLYSDCFTTSSKETFEKRLKSIGRENHQKIQPNCFGDRIIIFQY